LGPDQSALLRERLLGQVVAINSTDEAALWARHNLSAKNTLTAGDARIVEEEFQTRLSTIGDGEGPSEASNPVSVRNVMPACRPDTGDSQKTSKVPGKPPRNSAVRGLGKTVRLRDKEHRKFVSRQACLVCGRTPSDPHHLTFMQSRALGYRVSDEFLVPVCRIHHRELHRLGDEARVMPPSPAARVSGHTKFAGACSIASGTRGWFFNDRPRGGVSSPSILYRSRSSYGSTRGSMARPSRSVEAPSLGLQSQR
jgi:hypothetical protein